MTAVDGTLGRVDSALQRVGGDRNDFWIGLAVLGVAAVGAIAVAIFGSVVFLAAFGLIVLALITMAFLAVARSPIWAAYIFAGALPFLGGIDRGGLIPLLRPSEALQLFLTAAVAAGALWRAYHEGGSLSLRITRLDRMLFVFCMLASVWPLIWELLRSNIPSGSDVFSTIIVWRLFALYALFRWVVRTPHQVRRVMWIIVYSACVLGAIAVSEASGLFSVGSLWKSAQESDTTGRGGATLNSSIAVGDYLAYTFAIVLTWMFRGGRAPRWLLGALTGVLLIGSLGTGQFSAWIGALVVFGVVVTHEGQIKKALRWAIPFLVVGALVAGPVVATRLAGFGAGGSVLPQSWHGRVDNITNFYIPMLSNFRWVLGVRPDSVLQAPETWRQSIFLESGLLWFFWVGGIPLFIGFVFLVRRIFMTTRHISHSRDDDIGVAALAVRAGLCAMLILTLIDMHLTLRGGGDLFFLLLGLAANLNVPVQEGPRIPVQEGIQP